MQMTDINDIKWKVDIINYSLVYFFALFSVFLYLFYYFLAKFLGNSEKAEEKIITKKWLFDDIKIKLESLKSLNNEEFYEKYSRVFFEFMDIIYWSDLRKKTLKELKKIIKDKEILDIIGSFYYKWFMDNLTIWTEDEKDNLIEKFKKEIEKRETK